MAWSKESSSARGYGHRWEVLRQRVLARDLGLCQSHRRRGETAAADCVDHIRPRSQGGDETMLNCQSLCSDCHRVKTHLEEGRRLRPTIGLDGWPIAEVPVYTGPLWRHGRQVAAA